MGEIMSPKLSECDAAIAWLRQFEIDDQASASAMLDAMVLVSHEEFFDRLSTSSEIASANICIIYGILVSVRRVMRRRAVLPESKGCEIM